MEERYTILTLGTVRDTKREIRRAYNTQNNEGTLKPSREREIDRERERQMERLAAQPDDNDDDARKFYPSPKSPKAAPNQM